MSSTTTPQAVDIRSKATSPPLDPSKLNQQPAPLPIPIPSSSESDVTSTPLRSTPSDGDSASAYLDTGVPVEPASHPTVAETGVPTGGDGTGPGPKTGQLQRNTSGPKSGGNIIRLGSLGGDGLDAKPPPAEGENGGGTKAS
ncbi:hypothetical protein BCR39DRAFT_516316 [Naematelia encephala]|uniref:Uncharacterized protein n=1 Tax=Naematelia encephala TaxID=71784 RepID=A0A1Y2BJV0_9TREE|nr:hypothetical protein BCR39DRAFT_516316 [Naematelia encephala]